jgi:hypothetical protein
MPTELVSALSAALRCDAGTGSLTSLSLAVGYSQTRGPSGSPLLGETQFSPLVRYILNCVFQTAQSLGALLWHPSNDLQQKRMLWSHDTL